MTERPESPLLDEHDHLMDEAQEGHDHHDHDHALNVIEEPLDPASQSLSDALRASFRVLKAIMLIVVVLFLFSGVYRVDTNERVIVSHLGKYQPPEEPGLHFAWPYPIDERISINIGQQTLPIDTFWFTLSDADKNKQPSELGSRGQGLDPAVDGALLTGDHAIMNLKLIAQYRVPKDTASVVKFATNVSDVERLLRSTIQNASIAEAARSSADELLKAPSEVAARIKNRAQARLIELNTGIELLDVAADKSYYPLQTADAFLQVSQRENGKREAIQAARSEQQKKLNGVAGEAWQDLYDQIQRLDQEKEEAKHKAVLDEIDRLLVEKAAGEAGGKIRLAQSRKQQVISETQGRIAQFEAMLKGYREHPELVRRQLRQKALTEIFDQKGLKKWYLPAGDKQVFLSFGQDPIQAREIDRDAMSSKVGDTK